MNISHRNNIESQLSYEYYYFICPLVKTHLKQIFFKHNPINITPKKDLIEYIKIDGKRRYGQEITSMHNIKLEDLNEIELRAIIYEYIETDD